MENPDIKLTEAQERLYHLLMEHDLHTMLYHQNGQVCAECENWTDGGEDMVIDLQPLSLEEFKRYVNDYDVDEHVSMMYGDPGYRNAFTLQEAIDDQKKWLEGLRNIIRDIEAELSGNQPEPAPEKKAIQSGDDPNITLEARVLPDGDGVLVMRNAASGQEIPFRICMGSQPFEQTDVYTAAARLVQEIIKYNK